MPDVKEVINGLEMSYKYSNIDEDNTLVPQRIVLHTLALLKAQEAVEPVRDDEGTYYCGACGESCVGYANWNTLEVERLQKYCSECGRKVKWDE